MYYQWFFFFFPFCRIFNGANIRVEIHDVLDFIRNDSPIVQMEGTGKREASGQNDISTNPDLSGLEWWKRNMKYRLGLTTDEKEKQQFEHDYRIKQLPKQCTTCEEGLDWMLKYSPSVIFMMDHVKKQGGNINRSNIKCDVCDDLKGGGFNPDLGILLCSNWIRDKWHLEDVLTHELVHAYDYLKFNVDYNNLKHHACTEIRASMLSGECRIWNEIKKTGFGGFGNKFQSCIKRRATLSVAANPRCSGDEEAEKVVESVFQSCFNDTRPFERVYR